MNRSAKQGWSMAPFLAWVACAELFILVTSLALPDVVASHFGASGKANGFMPRVIYMWLMLAIVAFIPLVLVVVPLQAFRNPNARINLPNSEYWLAPERRAETIETLSRQSVRFSTLLLAFLCYAHWLVIQANKTAPPGLSSRWFFGGLAVFLVATLVWATSLIRGYSQITKR